MIFLDVVIALQTATIVMLVRSAAEERRRFLAAVMAKDPGEFAALERATAPRPKAKPKQRTAPRHPIGL